VAIVTTGWGPFFRQLDAMVVPSGWGFTSSLR
jgi:hypothetical protein